MIRTLMMGLLLAGVVNSASAFSYTGFIESIPSIEPIPIGVHYKKDIKAKVPVKSVMEVDEFGDVVIWFRKGVLQGKKGIIFMKDEFKRLNVKIVTDGIYKYSTNNSISVNGKLRVKVPKNSVKNGTLKLKAGDILLFRTPKVDVNLTRIK